MKRIICVALSVFLYGIVSAQLLFSTKFESQNVGTAYTRPMWQSDGFNTGSWDGFLSTRTVIDDSYSYSGEKSLRVSYPKGCYGNSTNGTGAQVDLTFDDRDEAYMSYWIRFSDDFSWGTTNEGGKLPGLGSGNTSGDKISDGTNGFTARFMWRTGGRLVVLLYHMDFTSSMGEDVELFYPDGSPVIATRGVWHHIAERVKTNSVSGGKANADGELEVWFDGQRVLLRKGLRFRVNNDGLNELYFSTFHGGGDASWAPTVDSYIWFDDMRIGTTYESVAMQSCENPDLGGDVALCGTKSVMLQCDFTSTQAKGLNWYKDGTKVSSGTSSYSATSEGLYKVFYDSAWCAQKSSVTVTKNLNVDLGEDQYVCSNSFGMLQSNIGGEGLNYTWKKDGTALSSHGSILPVKDPGTYSLTVSQSGCADASDEVVVTSGLIPIADVSGKTGESITLQSPTSGNIAWYEDLSGEPVSTGTSFTTVFPQTETYIYAKDADAFEGYVGKPAIVEGYTYHQNSYNDRMMKFVVSKPLTIDEVTVYPYASQNVTVRIVDASSKAVKFTKTFTGVQGGEAKLALGASLQPGTYYMDGQGTTGDLLVSHDKDATIAYPYTIDGLISIPCAYMWNSENKTYYVYFYNWKVSTGNTCAATPIKLTGSGSTTDSYQVTFNVKGHGKAPASQMVEKNGTVVEPTEPTAAGCVFKGWFIDSDCTKSWNFSTGVVTANMTLYAKWELQSYTVKFVDYDDSVISTQTVEYGNSAKAPDNPTRKGYVFTGWNQDFSNVTENITVKAQYVENASSNRYEAEEAEVSGGEGVKIVESSSASNGKYVWQQKANLTFNVVVPATGEYELNFRYSLSPRTVQADGYKDQFLYVNGTKITTLRFNKTGDTDPTFDILKTNVNLQAGENTVALMVSWGWIDVDYLEIAMDEDAVYHTVTFLDWDNSVIGEPQTVKEGGAAVAPATPTRSGYNFNRWSVDFSSVTTDLTVVALYTKQTTGSGISVSIDAKQGNIAISPYMYAMNQLMQNNEYKARAKEAGIHMSRQNLGNNSTMYNWRKKLTVHPDWYNNVYAEDWDTTAQSMAKNFSDIQGMFGFQLIGRVASSTAYNFPEWEYNKAVRWEGSTRNLCGNGSKPGSFNTTDDGDITLYTQVWTPDSTTAILPHWQNDLSLDLNQFQYWNMDNEPEIWGGTHDAIITEVTDDVFEMYMQNYFATVKLARKLYPNIKICGPVAAHEWSWFHPAIQPTYKGKTYNWLEYFIMRCAEEEKSSGVKMIDVFDIHNYPEVTNAADIIQTHRMYWDTEYDYPGANGVKTVDCHWDNSITKEMVFVRCQKWFDTYFGAGYDVTYGTSEYNVKEVSSNNAMVTALAYAGCLGEGARHGMEFFIPWSWRVGMWETVHLFSRYAKEINVSAVSSNETMLSAYTSINSDRDSLTIIFTNRNESGTQTVTAEIANFNCKDGEYEVLTLSKLGDTETFVSHTENALKSSTATVTDGVLTIDLPAYSLTAVLLTSDVVEKYHVTFVDYDKSVIEEQEVLSGESAIAPDDPIREGYDFSGWDVDFTDVTKDLTVTATYTIKTFTVTFKDSDGTLIDEQIVEYGASAKEPTQPTKVGYDFVSWDVDFSNITKNLIVTAQFSIKTFTVTFKDSDGTLIDEQIVEYGASAKEPTQPTKAGYDFVSWDVDFSNITENLIVTAQFSIKTFTVTFKDWDGTIIAKQDDVAYGGNATLPENPVRDGFEFTGWVGIYENVMADETVTASYTEIGKAVYTALDNAIVTAEALTSEGYTESSWNTLQQALSVAQAVDRNLLEEEQSVVDAAAEALQNALKNLEKLTFTITFSVDGKVISTQTIVYGEKVEIPDAPVKTGYDFVKWDADFSTITSDMTITAIFQIQTFTVTFKDWDGSVIDEQIVEYASSATAPTAPEREGYVFSKWVGSFTNVTSNVIVTASYTEKAKADYSALDNLIAKANALVESKYSAETWTILQTALQNAKTVNRNLYADKQSEIYTLQTALQNAMDGLKTIDTSKLYSMIEVAKQTIQKSNGNIGTSDGQYPESAVVAFQSAIDKAQQVYENSRNQTEIDGEVEALQTAIQEFLNSQNRRVVDISTLTELVVRAEELLQQSDKDNSSRYRLLEYMDLYLAKEAGKTIIAQENPVTENVYVQVTKLENAIAAFENAYITAIDEVESLVKVYAVGKTIYVENVCGKSIVLCDTNGKKLAAASPENVQNSECFNVPQPGVYFVIIEQNSFGVIVK